MAFAAICLCMGVTCYFVVKTVINLIEGNNSDIFEDNDLGI